ncbi:tail fiber protein [Pseudomonas phage WP1]
MKWTRIRNPRWLDETGIHAMVTFEGIGEVPFTASLYYVEAHWKGHPRLRSCPGSMDLSPR